MLQQNIKQFKRQVEKYKADYFRDDEEYLVSKYFEKGEKGLVLGCGAGRVLLPMQKKGLKITAVDIVPEMVKAAQEKVRGTDIEVFLTDACALQFPDSSYDFVFFPFHGIDYNWPDIYVCVKEAARVLKPSGIFIFNSHNKWHIKACKYLLAGPFADYQGLITYRATIFDYFHLKKYFKKVKIRYRISLIKRLNLNLKDICYKFLPFLDKSIYFICQKPKK